MIFPCLPLLPQAAIYLEVHTYLIQLQTKDGKHVTDTISATSENEARRLIRYRYPNCIIFSVQKL